MWRQPLGQGWAGFAIFGSVAVTQEQRGEDECVVAYALTTGKQLWLHSDKAHYNKTIAEHLGITARTVEFHRANIFEKMGVTSAIELAHKLGRLQSMS